MSAPNLPMVAVIWEDAHCLDEGPWAAIPASRKYEPKLIYQVGFLLHDDPEGITLVHAWAGDIISVRDQIPRGMIRTLVPLKAEEPKRRGKR